MTQLTPPSNHVARFRRNVESLGLPTKGLGLAVSGGPDSLALLLLAAAAFPGRIAAATVDHGLRPESGFEALHVEDICARVECPHSILNVTVPDGAAGLQGEARQARYDVLRRWATARGLSYLVTAHHADDQAETILMRLQRGSGVAGLAGIRPVRRDGDVTIIRPLLGWTKAELVHLVSRAGVEPVEDPSNRDSRFDRAAMRSFLSGNPQFQPHRLSRTAAAMREADEALAWIVDQLQENRISIAAGEWRIDHAGLPREIRRRLLWRTIAELRSEAGIQPQWTGGEDVEPLLTALETGSTATLAGVMARAPDGCWHLRVAPPRRETRS